MSAVESSTPAAEIDAPVPITIPAGLTSHTRPLAVSEPKRNDGMPPRTRFKAIELALSWSNVTEDPRGIENPFQVMITVGVSC